jgi:hypothetical protein
LPRIVEAFVVVKATSTSIFVAELRCRGRAIMPMVSTIEVPGYKPGVMQEIPGPSPELGPLPRLPTMSSQEALDTENEDELSAHLACSERIKAQEELDQLAEIKRLEQVARDKEQMPFDPKTAAEICERIAEGGVLKAVCAEQENFPSPRQARRWLRGNGAFAADYASAREERLSAWEDELVLIADDASKDKLEKRNSHGLVLETDAAAVSRSKLRVDVRKALLRANYPAKWREGISVAKPESKDIFAGMSLDRIEELARDAELEELVEQKQALDRENDERRSRGEETLDFVAFLLKRSRKKGTMRLKNPEELDVSVRSVATPLMRVEGRDAERYAEAWGVDLSDDLGRKIFDLEVKFMVVAHAEAGEGLPFSERIDLETFALNYRPPTSAERLRALADDIRREREGQFKTIPGNRP